MLIFKEKMDYHNPLNVVFLCGNKYAPENGKDKRVILKEFLKSSGVDCKAVILEENFSFVKNKRGYLAYDDIFISNLSEVEGLAALYADRIIIIHETISTAAEIGMFASNPLLTSKICILYPDDISIEEKKMSSFINLAFFNFNNDKKSKPLKIKYYPDVEVNRNSTNKSDYRTFFHENTIGEFLGKSLLNFVKNTKGKKSIEIKSATFGKVNSDKHIISYSISNDDNQIDAFIHTEALKIQLLSLFAVDMFRTEFRKEKSMSEHVTYIEENYKKILLNSICTIAGIDTKCFSLNLQLIGANNCKLRQAIGYFLYMLQAIEFIGLEQVSDENYNTRRIRIKEPLDAYVFQLKGYIYDKPKTVFGGIMS